MDKRSAVIIPVEFPKWWIFSPLFVPFELAWGEFVLRSFPWTGKSGDSMVVSTSGLLVTASTKTVVRVSLDISTVWTLSGITLGAGETFGPPKITHWSSSPILPEFLIYPLKFSIRKKSISIADQRRPGVNETKIHFMLGLSPFLCILIRASKTITIGLLIRSYILTSQSWVLSFLISDSKSKTKVTELSGNPFRLQIWNDKWENEKGKSLEMGKGKIPSSFKHTQVHLNVSLRAYIISSVIIRGKPVFFFNVMTSTAPFLLTVPFFSFKHMSNFYRLINFILDNI